MMGLVFSGSTALAGLILVFLGSVFNTFDGYEKQAQSRVAGRFKRRAWVSFLGFLCALGSAAFALFHELGLAQCVFFPISLGFLALAAALVVGMAVFAVRDIK